jgi:hypothetical protein
MSVLVRAFGALLLVVVGGCGSALAEGESQFKKGRYPEAKQTFASIEDDAVHYDDAKRAEYALYRGLTFGALGDRVRSALWLREANALDAAHPGSLSAEDSRRLRTALAASDAP